MTNFILWQRWDVKKKGSDPPGSRKIFDLEMMKAPAGNKEGGVQKSHKRALERRPKVVLDTVIKTEKKWEKGRPKTEKTGKINC